MIRNLGRFTMQKRIPYSCQDIDEHDIEAVVESLRSALLTQGPQIAAFEGMAASYAGAPHAVAVSNGTAALHIACQALGLGAGGLLWTSPNSFVASANAGLYLGADVDFVDISQVTGSIAPEALEEKLSRAATLNRLPDIVMAVHFAGHTHEFSKIAELCGSYGIKLVEDASHAFGAMYEGSPKRKVGAHPASDAAVFSFHPVKSMTTGEGGMIMTRHATLAASMRSLRSHGITKDSSKYCFADEETGAWYYEQQQLGYNYRITDFQAALGMSQLGRLDDFMARRRSRAARYRQLLQDLPLNLPPASEVSSWHLYVVRIDAARTAVSRKSLFDRLRSSGIEAHVHYIPIHLQPYYRDRGFSRGDFPNAEEYYNHALSLPIFPQMTDDQQDYIVDILRQSLGNA